MGQPQTLKITPFFHEIQNLLVMHQTSHKGVEIQLNPI